MFFVHPFEVIFLRRLIKILISEYKVIKGLGGDYLFWARLDEEILDYFKGLELPTVATKMEFTDKLSALIHEDILQARSLSPGSFRPRILRKVFFKSFKRKALIIPENLAVLAEDRDEAHPNRKKITISFFLPRGSYGTMLIKRATL